MSDKYKLVLGLEIHLHLNTAKKMFCYCDADIWQAEPNTHTCPVCLGLPGALPVPNYEAIKKTQLLGLALDLGLNKESKFDRKHYFYPDLPKGYQISQYKQPLCTEGSMMLDSGNTAEIERIHLEEDVAKSFHEKGRTLIDFNKSGVPLVEIVTKPCFTNTDDAVDFCKKIQNVVRFLEIGDVDMEKGQMRLEANISLRTKEMEDKGELAKYKVEVKNINSFRFMEKAVKAEIVRQTEILESGGQVLQENRGYDEVKNKTVSQRSKEEAHDYRYFPEPDIPPMVFDDAHINELKSHLPELPLQAKKRMIDSLGIGESVAHVITDVMGLRGVRVLDYLISNGLDPVKSANFMVNKKEVQTALTESNEKILDLVKSLFASGNKETLSEEDLNILIDKIISENPKPIEDFKKGNSNSVQFLVGLLMRETKGKIDPVKARETILAKIA
jgi:aspartyl-tRNA(Asn)/glutamyl-tRNA(Gln) amidotransferase subunit B